MEEGGRWWDGVPRPPAHTAPTGAGELGKDGIRALALPLVLPREGPPLKVTD